MPMHSPPAAGMLSTTSAPPEDDPVLRRTFLVATGIVGGAVVTDARPSLAQARELDPAAVLAQRLEDILVGCTAPTVSLMSPGPSIRACLATARAEFSRAQYLPLSQSLPRLVTAAEAYGGPGLVAQSYNLVTRVLIKLRASGLEWISADRALRAATQAGEPLILVEAQRMMASVCRRAGHYQRAQELALTAAGHLELAGQVPDPRHLALHGMLMCTASYGAARAGVTDHAHHLLAEATTTAARLASQPNLQHELTANIASHQVSVAYVLGDAASALCHARAASPVVFPDAEREGRFLVDVALAYQALDKPEHAYSTLCEAERRAPGEVRTRSAVRGLVTDLLTQRRATLPGIRDLAIRTHAA